MNPVDREGLTFRQDYFDDPAAWAAIKTLLLDIFDVDISPIDRLGGPDPTSFPSAHFDGDGQCVANLSAFAMPVFSNGRVVKACGWQSGAVRPEYRGLGLYHDLIGVTLNRVEERGFEATLLYTDKPGLYQAHGFRIVPQYSFRGAAPPHALGQASARALDIEHDADLLRQLLARRTPVSLRLAVLDQATMFLLNCHLLSDLRLWLVDEEVVVAWRMTENVFELLDIVGPDMPSLSYILAALGISPNSVVTFVPPDRLDWQGDVVADTGATVLMMRADDSLFPTEPGCLSPLANF